MVLNPATQPLMSDYLRSCPQMRRALAERDVGVVFELLNRRGGVSLRVLGAAVGMTASRVQEIIKGRRQVTALQVFERIADALRVPGQQLGLAARPWETAASAATVGTTEPSTAAQTPAPGGEEATQRREALQLGTMAALPAGLLAGVLGEAAQDAVEFTRATAVTDVGAGVLAHLDAVVERLDRAYFKEPLARTFAIALAYRRKVHRLLASRHTLAERRELYGVAGWLSELLAWLADDLGDAETAEAYAIDSYQHAEQAGHGELCAWACDAHASIALHAGRPGRALAAAERGIARAPVGHPLAVRLHAQVVRAHGRLGNRDGCRTALRQTTDAYDRLPAVALGRQRLDTVHLAGYAVTAYPAAAFLALGDRTGERADYTEAYRHASQAVALHATPGSERPPSRAREAIAYLDLALACAALGDIDQAHHHGMRALETPRLVDSVRARAADLASALQRSHPTLPVTVEYAERCRALTVICGR